MSRGVLSQDELLAIHNDLPDLIPLQQIVGHLSPEVISMVFPPDSTVPEAAVCLRDAIDVATEARYAIHESCAHRRYYTIKNTPDSGIASVFFGKFYLDDAALRLYAAAEHLANAIVCMLAINDTALSPHGGPGTSRRYVVWRYLEASAPHHVIAQALGELGDSWLKTMRYRNDWVHNQPPTVAGQGIVFRRGNRWRGEESGPRMLAVSGGDEPEWTIDTLADAVIPSLRQFAVVLQLVVDHYLQILESNGFRLTARDPDPSG